MKGTKRVVGEAAADRQIKRKIIFKNWAMFTDSKYMHKYAHVFNTKRLDEVISMSNLLNIHYSQISGRLW